MNEIGVVGSLNFLIAVEDELALAREVAAKAIDRADAFAQLRSYTLEVQDELRRPVRASDVFDTSDEERRARLTALADRITNGMED